MNPTDLIDEFTRQADDAPSVEEVRAEVSRRFAAHARIRARRSLIAVAAAVILVAGGAAALAMILPKDSPSTAAQLTPLELVPVLATEQRDEDQLPGDGTAGNIKERLDPDSTRLIGDSERGKAWAALDGEGNICLVLSLPNGVSGATCPSPADFERSGARIEVSGGEPGEPHRYALAVLLPSDIPESSVSEAIRQIRDRSPDATGSIESFHRESTPLLLMEPEVVAELGQVVLPRSDGTELTLVYP